MTAMASTTANSKGAKLRELGIHYCMVRCNGSFVPLVPADQLPSELQLHHVPRTLTTSDLEGLRCLPELAATPCLTVEPAAAAAPRPSATPPAVPAAVVSATLARGAGTSARNRPATSTTAPPGAQPANAPHSPADSPAVARSGVAGSDSETQPWESRRQRTEREARTSWASAPALSATAPQPAADTGSHASSSWASRECSACPRHDAPPSGVVPNAKKKEFCTHWIRTGDCAYAQQGCKYKHEIPCRAKLQEIGFYNVPKWWKEKNAIRPKTWMQKQMEAQAQTQLEEQPKQLPFVASARAAARAHAATQRGVSWRSLQARTPLLGSSAESDASASDSSRASSPHSRHSATESASSPALAKAQQDRRTSLASSRSSRSSRPFQKPQSPTKPAHWRAVYQAIATQPDSQLVAQVAELQKSGSKAAVTSRLVENATPGAANEGKEANQVLESNEWTPTVAMGAAAQAQAERKRQEKELENSPLMP